MKNIHILPTTEKSRLHYYFELNKRYALSKEPLNWRTAHHVYITSDEVIHYSHNTTSLHQAKSVVPESIITTNDEGCWMINSKKIILTTDQDLIEDGVQEIDNEFLEWFVKNPTCKFVEVQKWTNYSEVKYKIIIPKEEPKQEFLLFDKERANTITSEGQKTVRELQNTIQQETLEEAAKEYVNGRCTGGVMEKALLSAIEFGANYQAERMFSEEDMSKSFFQGWITRERFDDQIPDIIYPQGLDYEEKQEYAFNLWFEQFKKK